MTSIRILVQSNQARATAEYQVRRAKRGDPATVSCSCVIAEILAVAKEQGLTVHFFTQDEEFHHVPLDLEGVKRVLGGEEAKECPSPN